MKHDDDSDSALWRSYREMKQARKAQHGIDCPDCNKLQPLRTPTRLLPGQRCKVCFYRDPRLRLPRDVEGDTIWVSTKPPT